MVIGAFGEYVYLLPFTWWLAWLLEPVTGATFGKRLLGLRVRTLDSTFPARRRLLARTLVQTAGLSGLTAALLLERWAIAIIATAAGLTVLMGCAMAFGRSRQTLHDRIAGTIVIRLPGPSSGGAGALRSADPFGAG
jgi:uncharacterized RDD family membrane protein YckC